MIGCYINPIRGYFRFHKSLPAHYELKHGKWDCVHYEFTKMIGLLAKGNPNVLASLWLDSSKVIYTTPTWNQIVNHRHLFISKNVYSSFSGYANDQLHKMTHMAFKGYMGPKRKRLVKKYGYDTKNAAHLIRLLRMGIEFLMHEELIVDRTNFDREELLDIKNGKWKLEKVKKEARRLFEIGKFYLKRSKMADECNRDVIEYIMVDLLKKHFRVKGPEK